MAKKVVVTQAQEKTKLDPEAKEEQKTTPAPEETPEPSITPEPKAKKAKVMYWKTNIYIPGVGVVKGVATEEQIKAFNASSVTDAGKFLLTYDPFALKMKQAKHKMKEKVGLV